MPYWAFYTAHSDLAEINWILFISWVKLFWTICAESYSSSDIWDIHAIRWISHAESSIIFHVFIYGLASVSAGYTGARRASTLEVEPAVACKNTHIMRSTWSVVATVVNSWSRLRRLTFFGGDGEYGRSLVAMIGLRGAVLIAGFLSVVTGKSVYMLFT